MRISITGSGFVGTAIGKGLIELGNEVIFYDVVDKDRLNFTKNLNHAIESSNIATPFVSASAALLLSADEDRGKVIRAIFGTAEDKGFPRWVQGHGLIRTDKALEVILCD